MCFLSHLMRQERAFSYHHVQPQSRGQESKETSSPRKEISKGKSWTDWWEPERVLVLNLTEDSIAWAREAVHTWSFPFLPFIPQLGELAQAHLLCLVSLYHGTIRVADQGYLHPTCLRWSSALTWGSERNWLFFSLSLFPLPTRPQSEKWLEKASEFKR